MKMIEVSPLGAVTKNGELLGVIRGFHLYTPLAEQNFEDLSSQLAKAIASAEDEFSPDEIIQPEKISQDPLLSECLEVEFSKRAQQMLEASLTDFSLLGGRYLCWEKVPIATLVKGSSFYEPRLSFFSLATLPLELRSKIEEKAYLVLKAHLDFLLEPLFHLRDADFLAEDTAKIRDALYERYGILPRFLVGSFMKQLDPTSRAALRHLGIRFGAFHLYLPLMLRPQHAELLTHLWAIAHDFDDKSGYLQILKALRSGRTSLTVDPTIRKEFYTLCGFVVLGKRAVRVDILERLADLIRERTLWQPGQAMLEGVFGDRKFYIVPNMLSILGATREDLKEILSQLGYVSVILEEEPFRKQLAELLAKSEAALPQAELVGPWAKDESLCKESNNFSVKLDHLVKLAQNLSHEEDGSAGVEIKLEARPIRLWYYHPRRLDKRPSLNNSARQEGKKGWVKAQSQKNEGSDKSRKRFFGESKKFGKKIAKPRQFEIKKGTISDSPFSALAQLRENLLKS